MGRVELPGAALLPRSVAPKVGLGSTHSCQNVPTSPLSRRRQDPDICGLSAAAGAPPWSEALPAPLPPGAGPAELPRGCFRTWRRGTGGPSQVLAYSVDPPAPSLPQICHMQGPYGTRSCPLAAAAQHPGWDVDVKSHILPHSGLPSSAGLLPPSPRAFGLV